MLCVQQVITKTAPRGLPDLSLSETTAYACLCWPKTLKNWLKFSLNEQRIGADAHPPPLAIRALNAETTPITRFSVLVLHPYTNSNSNSLTSKFAAKSRLMGKGGGGTSSSAISAITKKDLVKSLKYLSLKRVRSK